MFPSNRGINKRCLTPDKDKSVRVVQVKTEEILNTRRIHRLCLLEETKEDRSKD